MQTELNQKHYQWASNRMYDLHRFELLLHDDLDFEFLMMTLDECEYDFLHLYTAYSTQFTQDQRGCKTQDLLTVLRVGLVTHDYVYGQIEKDSEYNLSQDKTALKFVEGVPVRLRPLFGAVPSLLALARERDGAVMGDRQYEYQKRTKILEKAIQVLELGHSKLVAKGIGD